MNVYDFDGTIYPTNCTVEFFIWCLFRHPKLIITFAPKAAWYMFVCVIGRMPQCQLYRRFLGFLKKVENVDAEIERYWNKNEKKIASWYLNQKRDDDLIMTASPSCLIGPIAKRIGVDYVATEYVIGYGVFIDNFMYAKEKARYMIDHKMPAIENFYSDSLSDTPIALWADKAYLVSRRATKVEEWPKMDSETLKKAKKKTKAGWNIHI